MLKKLYPTLEAGLISLIGAVAPLIVPGLTRDLHDLLFDHPQFSMFLVAVYGAVKHYLPSPGSLFQGKPSS